MNKNNKEIYMAPRVKSVAFQVESGFEASIRMEIHGFLDRESYRNIDMDGSYLFGGNSSNSGSNEGYFTRELNVE